MNLHAPNLHAPNPLLVWVAALLLTTGVAVAAPAPGAGEEIEITLTLPAGDPPPGRAAFRELSCTTCHAVAGEDDFPAPVAHHAGPELTAALGDRSPGWIASSIVAPSHEVGPETRKMMEGELSPMGDFADAMTVRQLIDLVAYLEALGEM